MKNGKIVLVTGASRGIGAATAEVFARAGYSVALGYFSSREKAYDLAERLSAQGCDVKCYRADVGDSRGADELVSQVISDFGGLDIVINNAGIAEQKLLQDITDEDWRRMLAVNLDGVFYVCRRAARLMISQKSGRIINISSMWGLVGASTEAHYSAAKGAVIAFTKAIAKELAPSGITANCIAPGVVETDMLADFSAADRAAFVEETPVGRAGTPLDIARTALFLAGEGGEFYTGQVFSPNGGFLIL